MATGLLGGLDPQQFGLLSAGLTLLGNANGPNARNAFGLAGQAGLQGLLQGQQMAMEQDYQNERKGLIAAQAQKLREEQMRAAKASDFLANSAEAGFDPQAAIRAGVPLEVVKAYAEAPNLGRTEVSNFQQVRGPDGSVQIVGFDRFGTPVQTGQKPFEKPVFQDLGGQVVGIDPVTGGITFKAGKSQTPDGAAANAVAWANNQVARGNLGVAQGNLGIAQQRLELDRTAPRGQVLDTATGPIIVDPRTGQGRPVVDATGTALQNPKIAAENATRTRDAGDVLSILDQAEPLIKGGNGVPKATGSYFGNLMDLAGQAVGVSYPGAQSAAQLKALEGSLVSKMPKMSGPQSDKDVLLYRQMAGQIGDPTIPADTKLAAIKTIRDLNQRYVGGSASAPSTGGVPSDISNLLNKYGNR